ncbi:MAG: Zn-dependent hydrolase [Bacteroidales bacterium]|nr:Zn-dependent hydrolase [Bacteroidales bacterium]
MKKVTLLLMAATLLAAAGCKSGKPADGQPTDIQQKVDEYAEFSLTSDLIQTLSPNEKELVKLFIEIGQVMDDIYWDEYFGQANRASLDTLADPALRAFAQIHYGAWDRLDAERPFLPGYGERPAGCNFYPTDMTKEEFNALADPLKDSQYSVIRRNAEGNLYVLPYHEAYKAGLAKVDSLLEKAIALADNAGLKRYLEARREAFRTDDYFESDMVWMDMKDSKLDFVVGPIENYDDGINGLKCSHEAFVLVKDEAWSADLTRFAALLPEMQTLLPCDEKYKQEVPGTDCDINVYDVVYYAGDCNAGSKTIAINLPNDERVQLAKGSRRLQLKNAMQAKFDNIMTPIARLMVCDEQADSVTFNAFFGNTCYHEVAHGLGIKNTVSGRGPCRTALGAQYSAWEEAKADVCGLFLTEQLIGRGLITNTTVNQNYITFIAGILRSVRFGATEAHGVANIMCYNYFYEHGAFSRNSQGKYVIDVEKAREAARGWAALIIAMEGEGDAEAAKAYSDQHGKVSPALQADLDAIRDAHIPRDIVYQQGAQVLGL